MTVYNLIILINFGRRDKSELEQVNVVFTCMTHLYERSVGACGGDNRLGRPL